MMEKLLHERLRELENWCQLYERYNIREVSFTKLMESFADEIEKYYIPRPRFEDGEPVQFEDETSLQDCVEAMLFKADGSYELHQKFKNQCGTSFAIYEPNEFVKRPTTKVLDADGVPCKVGEITFSKKHGIKRNPIKSVHKAGEALPFSTFTPGDDYVVFENDRKSWDYASDLTHREPDTIKRIEDDATMPPCEYVLKHGISLGSHPADSEQATIAMVRDLLRRQREVLK